MTDCIFCKIVNREIPSYNIYEDADYFAFLDIYPRVKGHTLLIPKKHYHWVYDVPNFGGYWEKAKLISDAMQKALKPEFITFVTHGLEVPHAHIHILPRQKGETSFVPEQKKLSKEEMGKIAEELRQILK
ncbi:HIT domain-containing protein [Candidatus Roizmanbacteria bacterium]|nr:HIT domain-containing protein [Candidatus Roizmanbacteria bacterium]